MRVSAGKRPHGCDGAHPRERVVAVGFAAMTEACMSLRRREPTSGETPIQGIDTVVVLWAAAKLRTVAKKSLDAMVIGIVGFIGRLGLK
jgi:hypothetical protein